MHIKPAYVSLLNTSLCQNIPNGKETIYFFLILCLKKKKERQQPFLLVLAEFFPAGPSRNFHCFSQFTGEAVQIYCFDSKNESLDGHLRNLS